MRHKWINLKGKAENAKFNLQTIFGWVSNTLTCTVTTLIFGMLITKKGRIAKLAILQAFITSTAVA